MAIAMQVAKLDLDDLMPAEATLTLSGGETITLKPFTLREELHFKRLWGQDKLRKAMSGDDIELILALGYHLIKNPADKEALKTEDDFAQLIVSIKDRKALTSAVLETWGLSQSKLEDIEKQMEMAKKAGGENPATPTGASYTTNAPTPTAGA